MEYLSISKKADRDTALTTRAESPGGADMTLSVSWETSQYEKQDWDRAACLG